MRRRRCSRCSWLWVPFLAIVAPSVSVGEAEPTYLTVTFAEGSNKIHAVIVQVIATNRVTLHVENATLVDVVREISRQSRVSETARTGVTQTNAENLISLTFDGTPLQDALRMFVRIGPGPWSIDEELSKDINRCRVTAFFMDAPWKNALLTMLSAFDLHLLESAEMKGVYKIVDARGRERLLRTKQWRDTSR